MAKITFLDAKTLGDDISLECFKKYGDFINYPTTNRSETVQRVRQSDIIITNKVVIDKEVIDNAKNLKLICIAATGMNNVDLKYAKDRGIEVKNVAGYSTFSVAQHTFAMLFYLLSHSRYYDDYTKEAKWCDSDIFTHLEKPFFELQEKVWGIIGLGTIGKEVAKIAKAFGADVIYYSTSGRNQNDNYKRVDLNELIKRADIISIHAPLNENTYNLLQKEELLKIKNGSILLNLGRGCIINENDLAEVMDKKEIYVGLDVLCSEPMPKSSPLLKVKNSDRLFITPHIAWASKESRVRLVKSIEKNIKEFLDGKRA